ncbi:MAG: short-chain dehydrogenase/reductase [Rhodospirillales bacterium]|jgi:hypothetical protein|nr:short-chain dehydrogenase/reductase [Rhodospirillales bacterium]MDP6645531.1 short-chain dehydrogenase/reductase [Rhodospirillales bacterium]MDP6840855.1 short-chain dehydrogenase/reductase [Rhodospirillales bacterium]|tara:strand:- start:537 stop:1298 length:762 start_codon:yes stop_codon:yes gene_type:complete
MDMNLGGKTALVTGGSRGIGKAVAEVLAEEGCHLHLAARTEVDLQATAGAIRDRHNVNVEIHVSDLSNSSEVGALAEACAGIDILINNAGAIPPGNILDLDEAAWRQAWELKLFGYINMMRAIYPHMEARGSGVIVNVIGSAAQNPTGRYIAGGGANAALDAMTQALGKDSTAKGVRVCGLHPSITKTDRQAERYLARAEKELGDKERWTELLPTMPFGRPTEPREVADFVVFLASERASYTSGIVYTITGGV